MMNKRIALTIVVAVLVSAWGPIAQQTPVRVPGPGETPNLQDRLLPDLALESMRVYSRRGTWVGYWHFDVELENIGGFKGLQSLPSPPQVIIRLDIKECPGAIDYGRDDFVCTNAQNKSFTFARYISETGETRTLRIYRYLRYPHEVYATAKIVSDNNRIAEADAPDWGNNQAFLTIVMDPRRSSHQGGWTWVWPNDEDTLIY